MHYRGIHYIYKNRTRFYTIFNTSAQTKVRLELTNDSYERLLASGAVTEMNDLPNGYRKFRKL